MPVIRLVKRLCTFSVRVIFFLKHDGNTKLPYSKIRITNEFRSGTIISLLLY